MNFTPEMIAAAKTADSPAALIALAKERGILLTDSEAILYFRQLAPAGGELSDDELDAVSGGACGSKGESPYYYDVFNKTGGTSVKSSNGQCPNCVKNSPFGKGKEFTLYWDNPEQFYLYCWYCTYIWRNAFFTGDPRNHGFHPTGN